MTSFEQMLLDKGYLKFIFNGNTMKYEVAKGHTISTMVNLGHIYIHSSDTNLLNKIEQGKSVLEEDFTDDIRVNQICFGRSEKGKPPTLISPRPRIEIKRFRNDREVTENEGRDDSMNHVLKEIPFDKIFEAMFDRSIIFKFDLRE
jgi:hypothetical protein